MELFYFTNKFYEGTVKSSSNGGNLNLSVQVFVSGVPLFHSSLAIYFTWPFGFSSNLSPMKPFLATLTPSPFSPLNSVITH